MEFRVADGCRLRALEEADAAELYSLIDSERAHLAPWLPWAQGQTRRDTIEFIRAAGRQRKGNDGFQAAIEQDGAIIGVVGFHGVDWPNRSTSIGYWLTGDQQGRGTMTRAVRLLVDHAFGAWGLHRVEIRSATENRRSRAIPERLGFKKEGTARQAERVGERFLDIVVYAMLAPEWSPPAGSPANSEPSDPP